MAPRTITREKVFNWRTTWSQGDLRVIEEDLSRVEAVSFTTVANQYISCRNQAGRVTCQIYPGYIAFTPAYVPEGLNEGSSWRILSTFQRWSDGGPAQLENTECCSFCWTRLPLSGLCGCQD